MTTIVELVGVWVSVEADLGGVQIPEWTPSNGSATAVDTRSVVFDGEAIETPIYQRDSLSPGTELSGPAVIEQLDSTTLLWPRQQLRVDLLGQLLLGPIEEKAARA